MQQLLEGAKDLAAQYSPLVNVVLTTFIVLLTGWYAFVTRSMWREMVEARRASVRPILDVVVDKPVLDHTNPEARRDLSSRVRVSNFGRGPGYATRAEVSLRYENERERTWISTPVDLPDTLAPGSSKSAAFTIHTFPTPMDEHRAEFLRLAFRCRDAEGHYYLVSQTYDLLAFDLGNVVSRTWRLRREDVRFAPFTRKARSTFDEHPKAEDMELVGSQRLPRWRDWASYQQHAADSAARRR